VLSFNGNAMTFAKDSQRLLEEAKAAIKGVRFSENMIRITLELICTTRLLPLNSWASHSDAQAKGGHEHDHGDLRGEKKTPWIARHDSGRGPSEILQGASDQNGRCKLPEVTSEHKDKSESAECEWAI